MGMNPSHSISVLTEKGDNNAGLGHCYNGMLNQQSDIDEHEMILMRWRTRNKSERGGDYNKCT